MSKDDDYTQYDPTVKSKVPDTAAEVEKLRLEVKLAEIEAAEKALEAKEAKSKERWEAFVEFLFFGLPGILLGLGVVAGIFFGIRGLWLLDMENQKENKAATISWIAWCNEEKKGEVVDSTRVPPDTKDISRGYLYCMVDGRAIGKMYDYR